MKEITRLYKKLNHAWRKLGDKKRRTIGLVIAGLVVILFIAQTAKPMIDPAAYIPLLNTIAKGESNGNYNAHFGNVSNTDIRFTDMTIAEVMRWQEDFVNQGNASNAVGRYQFMGTTLAGLVKQHRINTQAKFNESLQDHLAIKLIERRGAYDFVQEKITREQFAANLAMEWAALPRIIGDNPHESYYAGDGLNQALLNPDEILDAINKLKKNN